MAKFNLPEDKNYYTPNTLKTSSGQFFAPTYKTDETYVDPNTGSAYSKVSLAPVNKVPAGATTTQVKTPATSTGSGSGGTSSAVPAYKSTLDDLYNKVMGYGGYSAGTYTPGVFNSSVDTTGIQGQLNGWLNEIDNYEPFKYDLNADMLYRQAVDNYAMLGQQAMQDTMGNAAALTGGYGNSYAAAAGNQAYQQYITQANNMIPQFQQMAMDVWQSGLDQLLSQYNAGSMQLNNLLSIEAQELAAWQAQEALNFDAWSANEQNAYNEWLAGYSQAQDQYELAKDYYATLEAMQKASGGSGGGSSSKTSGKTSSNDNKGFVGTVQDVAAAVAGATNGANALVNPLDANYYKTIAELLKK